MHRRRAKSERQVLGRDDSGTWVELSGKVLRLLSDDAHVSVDSSGKPEFDAWRWVSYWYPVGKVVAFKRDVYRRALKQLAPSLVVDEGI